MAIQPRGANLNAGLNHKIGGSLRLSVGRVRTANHVLDLLLAVYRAPSPRTNQAPEGTMALAMPVRCVVPLVATVRIVAHLRFAGECKDVALIDYFSNALAPRWSWGFARSNME